MLIKNIQHCKNRVYAVQSETQTLRYRLETWVTDEKKNLRKHKTSTWKIHLHDLVSKLKRAYPVLAKLRHFKNLKITRFLHTSFALFNRHNTTLSKNCKMSKFVILILFMLDVLSLQTIVSVRTFSVFTENLKLASASTNTKVDYIKNVLLLVPSHNSVRFGVENQISAQPYLNLAEYDFCIWHQKSLRFYLLFKLFIFSHRTKNIVDKIIVSAKLHCKYENVNKI